jgi:hypothetical protein
MATFILANGIENEIRPENPGRGFTAEKIRNLLCGSFQLLPLDLERAILMNAYASKSRSPRNDRATELFLRALIFRKAPANEIRVLHGDILVAEYSEIRLPEVLASALLLI